MDQWLAVFPSTREVLGSYECDPVPSSQRASEEGFTYLEIECVASSLIWKDLAVNPNLVPVFNSYSGAIFDFGPRHAASPNPDPTLGFDPDAVLISVPVLVFDSDTALGFDLYSQEISY
ncbi:hypothetical protein EVAR_82378_1 [Eumeta japonica]|uniref:Uncharacterized protein n=1 Tax=Eumeta variegata TaxID=151549 RepID=A0A4C1U9U2_EUMVA|nr:hypothetical protein EVAR_82378_1 [Eumeta japonica]